MLSTSTGLTDQTSLLKIFKEECQLRWRICESRSPSLVSVTQVMGAKAFGCSKRTPCSSGALKPSVWVVLPKLPPTILQREMSVLSLKVHLCQLGLPFINTLRCHHWLTLALTMSALLHSGSPKSCVSKRMQRSILTQTTTTAKDSSAIEQHY